MTLPTEVTVKLTSTHIGILLAASLPPVLDPSIGITLLLVASQRTIRLATGVVR